MLTVLIVLIFLLLTLNPGGFAQLTKISFGDDIVEMLEDRDRDGLYEYMILEVEVNVYEMGSYGIFCSIGDGAVSANSGLYSLSLGSHTLEIRFPGNELKNYGFTGQYSLDLELFSSDPLEETITKGYQTVNSYDPDIFETPADQLRSSVEIREKDVLISSPSMEISVNKSSPALYFSYSGERRDETLTRLDYTELVAFGDQNGNGIWDRNGEPPLYRTDLQDGVDWSIDIDLESGYRIELKGLVQLRSVDLPAASVWGEVILTLDSLSINPEGTKQKFDITLALYQSIEADQIAVVQHLTDLSGSQKIIEGADSGVMVNGFNMTSLEMVNGDGETQGVYSWTDEVYIGEDEPDRRVRCGSTFDIDGGSARITFSYPIGDSDRVVYHDPTVGIKNFMPGEGGEDFLENRPLIMVGGLLIGIFLVGGSILIRIYGKRDRREGM